MDALETRLLNDVQRGFPLVPQPFRELAGRLNTDESEVLAVLARLTACRKVSRVGATFVPGTIGAATLAAMSVPEPRLRAVARLVSTFPEVNHNYEREHRYNLWFVVTGPDAAHVAAVLHGIESAAGCGRVLSLPMVEHYYVDLGFDLAHGSGPSKAAAHGRGTRRTMLTAAERAMVAVLQDGLPLTTAPYAELGRRAGMSEQAVIATLGRWLDERVINRLGVIVRHRELGFSANAMAVWDMPDDEVRAVGQRMARLPQVTLCYRRERRPPAWRYNLYCMIHGRSRLHVLAQIADVGARCDLVNHPHEVLFSRRCFKQRGARYVVEAAYG